MGLIVSSRRVAVAALSLIACAVSPSAGWSEQAPKVPAASILGAAAQGPDYQIASPVASDGLLFTFHLNTDYGPFTVHGEQMLKQRLHELAVLRELEKVSQSEAFQQAFAKAVGKPIDTVGKVLTNPVGTVRGTISGLGEALNKIGAGLNDPYAKRDGSALAGITGKAAAVREIAFQYNVDPYTTFQPLAHRLDQLAQAAALGGLVVKGATMAIPGAAGLAVGGLQTAGQLGNLVKTKTVAELNLINAAALKAMNVPQPVIDAFMTNPHYTPTDRTLIVGALQGMRSGNKAAYFAIIAQAGRDDLAYFHRLQAQWMAAYDRKVAPLVEFTPLLGIAFARRADGKLAGFFPVDMIAWTDTARSAAGKLTEAARAAKANGVELFITGSLTEEARKGFKALGWKVHEKDLSLIEGRS